MKTYYGAFKGVEYKTAGWRVFFWCAKLNECFLVCLVPVQIFLGVALRSVIESSADVVDICGHA